MVVAEVQKVEEKMLAAQVHHIISIKREMNSEIKARIDAAITNTFEYSPSGDDTLSSQDENDGKNLENTKEEEISLNQKIKNERWKLRKK
jgi:hypothetical protein